MSTTEILLTIIVSALSLIGVIVGIAHNRRQYLYQLAELEEKGGTCFDVDLKVNATQLNNTNYLIDIEAYCKNLANKKLIALAAYITFKPFLKEPTPFDAEFSDIYHLENFEVVDKAEKNNSLNYIKNAAYWENSLYAITPNEIEIFSRREIVSEGFTRKFPVIIVQIEIYVALAKELEIKSFPAYSIGKLRMQWCDYIRDKNKKRVYDVFSKAVETNKSNNIQRGQLILINEKEEIDIKNTKIFAEVLKTTTSINRQKVIIFP